jgi:hypothetical protein
MSATAATSSTTAVVPAGTSSAPLGSELEIPSDKILTHAARIAIEQDKPIMLDYYMDTKLGVAFIGEDSKTKDKMLVRSEEEYTSLVQKMFRIKGADDFIIITENSIYIVAGNIKKKTISTPA